MTQNQLKYWELRWRQHYENAQLNIDQQKLQLEIDRLYETMRHNKVSERIEKQRVVNDRIKLSQDWEKIQNDYRAKIVELGLNAAKIQSEWQTKMRGLDQKDRELAQNEIELSQKAEKLLVDKMTVVGDIMVSLKENQDKDEREKMKILADAVGPIGKSLGFGLLGVLHAKIESSLKSSEYQTFVGYLENTYPEVFNMMNSSEVTKSSVNVKQYTEMYGPEAPNKLNNDIKNYLNVHDPKSSSNSEKDIISGFTNTDKPATFNTNAGVIETGSSGANYYSDHKNAGSTKSPVQTKHNNTGVIYSGGSHYGPGYV